MALNAFTLSYTVTTIHLQIFHFPKQKPCSQETVTLSSLHVATTLWLSVSMDLIIRGISYRWNHIVPALLYPTDCTQHPIFKVHPHSAHVRTFFLRLNNIPVYVCTSCCLLTHLLMGYLGCVHLLAMNVVSKYLFPHFFQFFPILTKRWACWIIQHSSIILKYVSKGTNGPQKG